MGTAQGRELRARGRRTMERLLDAGATVFAQRGYHAARVDDIVNAARTSHGTFYLYFANKEELFRELAVAVAEEMAALAGEFPSLEPADATGDLRDWLARFSDLYGRAGAVIRAWTEAEMSDSEFGRIGGDLVREFTDRIATRIHAAAPDVDASSAAMAIIAMIERTNYLLVSGSLPGSRDALLDTLAVVIDAAIHGDGAAAARARGNRLRC